MVRLCLVYFGIFSMLFGYAYMPKDSVGQKIISGKRCIIYKIEQGNTVSGLAQKYNTSLAAIKEVNPEADLDKISVGQTIHIPRGNSSQSTNTVKTPSQPVYYIVKAGDTPGGIAQKHGISLQTFYTWNGFKQTPVLQIGQKLIVGYSDGQGNVQNTTNTNNNNNTNTNTNFDNPNPQIKVVAQDETGKKDVVNEVFVKPYQKKTETGKALITDSLLKSDTFGAIHKDIKTGTIITIINPANKKSVYARIEANDPKLTDYLLKITPAIAEMLKSTEKEFNIEIKYVQ